MYNKFKISFLSKPENEGFARNVIAMFLINVNPVISILNDIKTAVSEAVTNAIVHGYPDSEGIIEIQAELIDNFIHIEIKDNGVGISNVENALKPMFTTGVNSERSGMGFTVMQAFMDDVKVVSKVNEGTTILMYKNLLNAV